MGRDGSSSARTAGGPPGRRRSLEATTIFGTLVWIINFFILPDVIGRPWFKEAPMVAQFIYHAFFYAHRWASAPPCEWASPALSEAVAMGRPMGGEVADP
ncbi:MAG: hypothetical protein H0W67_09905 [Gemmatimonadales bacterium]|nr:hypothetical protein [Gemmatimonadales bacterium]